MGVPTEAAILAVSHMVSCPVHYFLMFSSTPALSVIKVKVLQSVRSSRVE